MLLIFIAGIIVGVVIGRLYAYMKYHYPENQETINVKIAKRKLQRLRLEEEQEEIKARIDESLNKRINV